MHFHENKDQEHIEIIKVTRRPYERFKYCRKYCTILNLFMTKTENATILSTPLSTSH